MIERTKHLQKLLSEARFGDQYPAMDAERELFKLLPQYLDDVIDQLRLRDHALQEAWTLSRYVKGIARDGLVAVNDFEWAMADVDGVEG